MEDIYLAGGLFNAGERLHNLFLEKYLKELGYRVILPQRRALDFLHGQDFDIPALCQDCADCSANEKYVYVGNLDGADADSGTCVEYGVAIISAKRAVTYRTDFRTAIEKEVGVNAMLNLKGTKFIYHPCFMTELDQVEPFYRELAQKIHEAIQSFA